MSISGRSTLYLEGPGISVGALALDGALIVRAVPGATVSECAMRHAPAGSLGTADGPLPRAAIKRLRVENAGWEFVPLAPGEDAPLAVQIRGFKLIKHAQRELTFDAPGDYVVDEA